MSGSESDERLGHRLPFSQEIAGIGLQVLEAIRVARRPGDIDGLGPIMASQAEVEPLVGGRQIATAAEPPGGLPPACTRNDDSRPCGVARRASTFQSEHEEVSAYRPVMEIGEW